LGLLIVLLSFDEIQAQVITNRPGADTMKVVNLINADRLSYFRPDSTTDLQVLAGNVQMQQGTTIFYCDSAVFNKKTRFIEAFGNVRINDNDSVNITSRYLQYYVDTKMAYLKKNVKLTDSKTTLLTEDLTYDLNTKIGEYRNGGKVINQQSVLTSKEGTYYEELKDVYFKKNVELKDPKYQLSSDSLLYNTSTQMATFIAPTKIVDSAKRTIRTSEGFYDLQHRKAFFGKRPVLTDGPVRIIANTIDSDDSTGISKLRGSVVYVDTAQGYSVLANYIDANRDDGTFLATQHPLLIIRQENDSVYITGDTMYSGRLSKLPATGARDSISTRDTIKNTVVLNAPNTKSIDTSTKKVRTPVAKDTSKNKNDSTDRYFQVYHRVRIFSDSMQAVSDSLWYSGKDSIFRLFKDPIMWASNSQITGDTIYMYTKNKKPDRLYVFENGLAINVSDTLNRMYNQIKGNRLHGYFNNGEIDYMRAQGNAESVYYVKDDKDGLVGINNATSDIIDIRFKNKELNKVVYIGEVEGTMYPVKQATEQNKFLRGFKWLEDRRPKTRFELFADEVQLPPVPKTATTTGNQ
jgi:lipopolysaccharide export system protein LptA